MYDGQKVDGQMMGKKQNKRACLSLKKILKKDDGKLEAGQPLKMSVKIPLDVLPESRNSFLSRNPPCPFLLLHLDLSFRVGYGACFGVALAPPSGSKQPRIIAFASLLLFMLLIFLFYFFFCFRCTNLMGSCDTSNLA